MTDGYARKIKDEYGLKQSDKPQGTLLDDMISEERELCPKENKEKSQIKRGRKPGSKNKVKGDEQKAPEKQNPGQSDKPQSTVSVNGEECLKETTEIKQKKKGRKPGSKNKVKRTEHAVPEKQNPKSESRKTHYTPSETDKIVSDAKHVIKWHKYFHRLYVLRNEIAGESGVDENILADLLTRLDRAQRHTLEIMEKVEL